MCPSFIFKTTHFTTFAAYRCKHFSASTLPALFNISKTYLKCVNEVKYKKIIVDLHIKIVMSILGIEYIIIPLNYCHSKDSNLKCST